MTRCSSDLRRRRARNKPQPISARPCRGFIAKYTIQRAAPPDHRFGARHELALRYSDPLSVVPRRDHASQCRPSRRRRTRQPESVGGRLSAIRELVNGGSVLVLPAAPATSVLPPARSRLPGAPAPALDPGHRPTGTRVPSRRPTSAPCRAAARAPRPVSRRRPWSPPAPRLRRAGRAARRPSARQPRRVAGERRRAGRSAGGAAWSGAAPCRSGRAIPTRVR